VLATRALGTDPVRIRSATDVLGYATVALAARSRGARALAVDLLGAAQTAIENLLNRYVRPEQTTGRRGKPYGYRRGIAYLQTPMKVSPGRDAPNHERAAKLRQI